jgi:hypothetical protein
MAVHVGFLVAKLALELLSLSVLRFFAVTIISPMLRFIITHYQRYTVQRVSLSKTTYKQSRLSVSLLSSGIPYSRLQRVTIPDAVIIQFVLLKMGMLMLETCRGL